jgi:hypothetical protein
MIKVYFENDTASELIAIFKHEEDYNTLSGVLLVMAKEAGYTKVTESIEVGDCI